MSDFCRCSEQMLAEAATNLCRWPDADVPWTLTALLPGFTEVEMIDMLQPYFAKWDRVRFHHVQSASRARVLVGCRKIDGQHGVLADCFLPCGNVRSVKLQFDVGENWTPEFLGQVAFHEAGHSLGLSHSPNRGNIMFASLDMAVKGLGQWDRAEQAKRYAEIISPVPKPSPVPPTSGDWPMDFFKTLIMNLLKTQLQKWLDDGTLVKWLTDLLTKINSGNVKTVEQLMDAGAEAMTAP